MAFLCTLGLHAWEGCKCVRCGKTRDSHHSWDGCMCVGCGIRADAEHGNHEWQGCKCSVCGQERDTNHSWKALICERCGKERDFADVKPAEIGGEAGKEFIPLLWGTDFRLRKVAEAAFREAKNSHFMKMSARTPDMGLEWETEGATGVEAAYWANLQKPEGHYLIARRVVSQAEGTVRVAVKAAVSPLARLPETRRGLVAAQKEIWRQRAEDFWSSTDMEGCHCDNNRCLIDGQDISQSKQLLRGEGFMPGGRPIYCEQCADEKLYEQYGV